MEKRSPFRIYGNHIKSNGVPTNAMSDTYLQMISSWDSETIKDMYYEFSIEQLKQEIATWQYKGKSNVCRAIYDLVAEKDA